jgi:hypothetical protein
MRRGLLTIGLGLVAGLFAYSFYYKTFKPCEDDTLECQLSWIQDYLSLTPDQYELVLAMHRDRQPEITELEQKILQLEDHLAALESERIENDRIDFIVFYSYLQEKVDLDRTRNSSTETFLTKVGSVMNTNQKERFDQLIREFKASDSKGS